MWTDGKFTALPTIAAALAADMAEASGVNRHGHVVGHFTRASEAAVTADGRQKMYGFLYKDGVVSTTFDYPGSGWMSCAFDASASGEVVGHYVDLVDGGVTGFVWKDGRFVARLRVPGARETYPQTILGNGILLGSALGQTRKDAARSPYIGHIHAVIAILHDEGGSGARHGQSGEFGTLPCYGYM